MSLAEALTELQMLTEQLRRDCPWDREQTERTIVPHTVEEAYEVADAAMVRDDAKLADELGDLLFQVYFLALLLEERGSGDLEAVARGVHEKLVRRHPHVFGDADARTPGRVRERWDEIKRTEEEREGIFQGGFLFFGNDAGINHFDALWKSDGTSGGTNAYYSFDVIAGSSPRLLAGLGGDVFFAAVNVARRLNVDPELALRTMTRRFVDRVERAEQYASAEGKSFAELELEEQDRYFDRAKVEFR